MLLSKMKLCPFQSFRMVEILKLGTKILGAKISLNETLTKSQGMHKTLKVKTEDSGKRSFRKSGPG